MGGGALLGDAYGQFTAARTRRWSDALPRELQGAHVLIVGFGSIGEAVRRRLEPFGIAVTGVARSARHGVRAVADLPELVGHADAVVVLAPLTPETDGLIDAALLARMRDGALLVNAGRGRRCRHRCPPWPSSGPAGCARSSTSWTREPLPDDHPLWDEALAITPHNAGDTPAADERAIRFGVEQLGRFARGEPLENVVREARRR